MSPPAELELKELDCVRGGRRLFKGLNAHIVAGEVLRVQGANGAGKTSLLRMICGLLLPTRGKVLWCGQEVAGLREDFGRQLVYLGHAAALKGELSALENLLAASLLGGIAARPADAMTALDHAGLREREQVPARMLSQGQRQRVALARLELGSGAPLWILDEPFNALDAGACAWLIALISGHVGQGGIVVLTSHQSVTLRPGVRERSVLL